MGRNRYGGNTPVIGKEQLMQSLKWANIRLAKLEARVRDLEKVREAAEDFWQQINRSTASFDRATLRRALDAYYRVEGPACIACRQPKRGAAVVYGWVRHTCDADSAAKGESDA